MIKFGKDWENFKFKGSVGEVNCLKREKNARPTRRVLVGLAFFSLFRQFTSPTDPLNLKFSQSFPNYYYYYYYYYYYLHVRVGVNHASMIHIFAYAEHDKQDYDKGKKLS